MLLKLKVTDGSNSGKEIVINKDRFLIGRADDCNLRPHSDAISRRHCVIITKDKLVGVRDLKSRNGTVVNGTKITGDKRLRHGDTLEVGPLKFEVVLEETARSKVQPKVNEKAKASAESVKKDGSEAMGGMVSQWLEEADDVAREEQRVGAPETREYRFDDTNRIELDQAASDEAAGKQEKREASDHQEETKVIKGKGEDKAGSKAPKFEVKKESPKDTQEAAQQVLRRLFNRG